MVEGLKVGRAPLAERLRTALAEHVAPAPDALVARRRSLQHNCRHCAQRVWVEQLQGIGSKSVSAVQCAKLSTFKSSGHPMACRSQLAHHP